jgi:hypothetical protein
VEWPRCAHKPGDGDVRYNPASHGYIDDGLQLEGHPQTAVKLGKTETCGTPLAAERNRDGKGQSPDTAG